MHTSDKRGAGTDANVFIDIHGDAANSGKIVLDNSKNNFERGMVSVDPHEPTLTNSSAFASMW